MKKLLVTLLAVLVLFPLCAVPATALTLHTDSPTLKLVNGFEGGGAYAVDTAVFKEGAGSATASCAGPGLTLVEQGYGTPIDLSAYGGNADAYVYLWLYLENAAAFDAARNEAFIEFSSGGGGTVEVARYNLSGLALVNGWNELYLPITDFVRHTDMNVAEIDWSAVNYNRVYMFHTADQVMKVDGLYVGFSADFADPPPATLRLLEPYEDLAKFAVDTANFKEGTGSATVSAGANAPTIIERIYDSPMDLSAYGGNADAWFHLWLYLEDADTFNRNADGYMEFSSGGGWGAGVARYNLTGLDLTDGWNELYLPATGFVRHSDSGVTAIDWSAVNYIRVYLFSIAAQTMKLDGLQAGLSADFPDRPTDGPGPDPSTRKLLEPFEDLAKFTVDTANFKEGTGSATVSAGAGAPAIIERIYDTAMDLSAYGGNADAWFHLWLYLEDTDAFNRNADGYMEFSSGGGWGAGVARYDLTGLELTNGWNELYLPATGFVRHSDPGVTAIDWSAVNYIRVYLFSTAAQTLKTDGLEVGLSVDFPDMPPVGPGPDPDTSLRLLEPFEDLSKFTVDTTNFKEGAGSATTSIDGSDNILTLIERTYAQPMDLSAYKAAPDGMISLWLYIEDAAIFNRNLDAFLEFSSGGGWGAGVARYDLTGVSLKNGWNELFLSLDDFARHVDTNVTECNWAAVNYLRVYLFSKTEGGGPVSQTLKLDGLYIGTEKDFDIPQAGTLRLLEPFDDSSRFTVDRVNLKEGTGSAITSATGAGDMLTLVETTYQKPKDLSFYAGRKKDAYIRFWLYVENPEAYDEELDGYLEFSSGGGWGAGVARYDVANLNLKAGWNDLYIPLAAFKRHSDPAVTAIDWSAVNYLRFYFFSTAPGKGQVSQTIRLDGMYIGLKSDFKKMPAKAAEGTLKLLEPYDDARRFTIDGTNYKEGTGSAIASASGTEGVLTLIERRYRTPKNLSYYEGNADAYVGFWLYLENALAYDDVLDGYLEFSSAGSWDAGITRYDMALCEGLKDGWNHLYFPVTDFEAHTDPKVSGCDWSKINYIRFYIYNTAPGGASVSQTIRLDGMYIGLASDFGLSAKSTLKLLEPYDDARRFEVDRVSFKQGSGAAVLTAEGTDAVLTAIERGYRRPKDLTFYRGRQDAYASIWLYLENAAAYDGELDGYLEFSSGGSWESGVARYDLADFENELHNGWNRLYLPISGFENHTDPKVTPCDWSKIDYIRFYLFSTAPGGAYVRQTMRLDGLYVGLASDFDMPARPGTGSLTMIEPFDDARRFTVDTADFKEGSGSATVSASGTGDVLTLVERTYRRPKDLSLYRDNPDAYLRLWLYLEDVDAFNRNLDGYLELSSGGSWAAEVNRYEIALLDLRNGWNEITVPVSGFMRHNDPEIKEADWSKINYIRFYIFNKGKFGSKIEQTLKLDGLCAGLSTDFASAGSGTVRLDTSLPLENGVIPAAQALQPASDDPVPLSQQARTLRGLIIACTAAGVGLLAAAAGLMYARRKRRLRAAADEKDVTNTQA